MERSDDKTSWEDFRSPRETKTKRTFSFLFVCFQSIPLPSLENLEEKSKEIDKYKNYTFKNEDITKIVEEKKRFRKAPINYAMTKNEILKEIVKLERKKTFDNLTERNFVSFFFCFSSSLVGNRQR